MENDNISKHNGLMGAIRHYSNPATCIEEVASVKWPDGKATCPRCNSKRSTFLQTRLLWKCKDCQKQFSVKVGTIFEDSAIGLDKWLCAMWMLGNCKNGVSSYEIARALNVTQKTAWFMLQRIRFAQDHGTIDKMSGHLEADEIFIGGKARNMHAGRREKMIRGRGPMGKAVLFGLLDRETGKVRTKVVGTRRKGELQREI